MELMAKEGKCYEGVTEGTISLAECVHGEGSVSVKQRLEHVLSLLQNT